MKVHAIQTGTVRVRTNQREGKGRGFRRQLHMLLDRTWTEPLPIYAWAIEHREGIIVVDTGDTARTSEPGYFPWWHPYFRLGVRLDVAPDQEVGPQLEQVGIAPSEVKTLILTHFHTDHAGGLHYFSRSEILVNAEDYDRASGFVGKVRGYLPHRWPEWFAPTTIAFEPTRVGPFEQSARVTEAGDVLIVPTPGHTPGHVSVIVEDDDVSYFLAGDTSYTQQLLLDGKIDGVSPDEQVSRATMRKIIQYARERPTVYLPSHDPQSAKRLRDQDFLPVGGVEMT